MTNDQFETLTQMIKGAHDDLTGEFGSLGAELTRFKTETHENFQRIFAHLQSHDGDLRMIKAEMMDMGKSCAARPASKSS